MKTCEGSHDNYKGKYFICFYDSNDEELLYMFENVKEILKFQGKKITKQSINSINVRLYRALRSNHIIRFLTGDAMKVHIFDINEEEE